MIQDHQKPSRHTVFDRARLQTRNPETRAGLGVTSGNSTETISFRRNDADRRPARVVLRPNDGPGDLARRYELAEERREAVTQRMQRMARNGETYKEADQRKRAFMRRLILEALNNRGRLTLEEIADVTGIDLGAVSFYTHAMATDGLLIKARLGNLRSPFAATITEAGHNYLEEVGS